MSEITKIAEKAADEIYGHVSTDGFGGIDFERKEIVKIIEEAARAAIEAYEAAKMDAALGQSTRLAEMKARETQVYEGHKEILRMQGVDIP